MEYTKRKNLNRGFIKLEAWQRAMDLFDLVFKCTTKVPDFKLRSQVRDAAQSVSANIAEGYCRRSLAEYLSILVYRKRLARRVSNTNFQLGTSGIGPWRGRREDRFSAI